jgi:hypothetical protein
MSGVKIARYGSQEYHMENPDGGTERHHIENPDGGTDCNRKTSHGKSR